MAVNTDDSHDSSALSLLRVMSRALVQEPQMWRFILQRAADQAKRLESQLGRDAIAALQHAFESDEINSREQLQQVAHRLIDHAKPSIGARFSPNALAGQSLLSALNEVPARAVAAG